MLRTESGAPANYTLPPLSSPASYTVQTHDTVQSIAQAYGVTPEELARTNGISTSTALLTGQALTLPPNAVAPTEDEESASPQTLAQQTDTAVNAYQQALKQTPRHVPLTSEVAQDQLSNLNSARQAMDSAVRNEIAGEIANRNNGVPANFQVPGDQLAASFGEGIVQRYQSDPDAQVAISASVNSYRADMLISAIPGNASPHDKLQTLNAQLQNQPQALFAQVLADPNVQNWVQAVADQVAQPYAQVKPGDVAQAKDQASQSINLLQTATAGLSPDLAAAVIQASMPTIQNIAQLRNTDNPIALLYSMQNVFGQVNGSYQADLVLQQAAKAYANSPAASQLLTSGGTNSLLEDSIRGDARYGNGADGNPSFAIALGNALQANGHTQQASDALDAAAEGVRDYLANGNSSPLPAYEAAHGPAEEKDQRLAELLSQSGPLTYEQQQKFIQAYHDDNAAVYDADKNASNALAAYLQNNQASLLFAAGRNSDAAKQLYSMMKDMTQSGQGTIALRLAADVQNDPTVQKAFSQFSDYQSTFLSDAVKSAQGELLVENGGDTKAASDQLVQLADPVFKGYAGWKDVSENYKAMADYKLTANGNIKAFSSQNFAEAFKEMGPVGKAWATCGVSIDILNGATTDQTAEMISSFSLAAGDASEVGSGALQVMAEAAKFGAYNASAETMSKLGAKLVPGLGVVGSLATMYQDGMVAANNPGTANGAVHAAATFADMSTCVGSIMAIIPGTQVEGLTVMGIGMLVAAPFQLTGVVLENAQQQREFRDDQTKYLKAAGLDDQMVNAMVEHGNQLSSFAQQLGLDPEPDGLDSDPHPRARPSPNSGDGLNQAEEIWKTHPEAFNQGMAVTQGIIDAVKACQIKPADVNNFLSLLAADNPNYGSVFFEQRTIASNSPPSPLTYNAHLVNLIGGGGFPNTKAYLQSVDPGIFSANGNARRQADCDYEDAKHRGGAAQIGDLLTGNHDAAYQTEIISIMKNDGTLDSWLKQIGSQYDENGRRQAAISALQNAQNAGALTAADAQGYKAELG